MSLGLEECGFLGGDGKAYYNSATYETPTWVEIDEAIDVSIPDFTDTMAEVATRSGAFALEKPAKTRVAVEMSYLYRGNKPVWDFLKGVKLAKGPIHLLILDGPAETDGSEGLELVANLVQFPVNQALEEMMTHDTFRFTPRYICESDGVTRIDPRWVVMATGQPTPATVESLGEMRSCCGGSRMNPVVVKKLVETGKMAVMPTLQKLTVAEAVSADPKLKEHLSQYSSKMAVYMAPGKSGPPPKSPTA